MKRMMALLLSACLLFALSAPALAAEPEGLERVDTYLGQFSDVPGSSWYAEAVATVYEYGLMNGTEVDRFNPNGTLSLAEAITLASRLYSLYNGEDVVFPAGSPWYQPYVDYAESVDIFYPDAGEDYNAPITRREFALLMYNALPEEALPEINDVEYGEIPDVYYSPMDQAIEVLSNAGVIEDDDYTELLEWNFEDGVSKVDTGIDFEEYAAVYSLYRAGILTGNDEFGTFTPQSNISRAAVATILSRIVEPSQRKTLNLVQKRAKLVPMYELESRWSLQKNASDEQLAEAYEVAAEIVTPLYGQNRDVQLCGIAMATRILTDESIEYSMEKAHYNDPYGFFVLHVASCAGCARATGLCLNMLGISYEHVNPNAYSHQWARVNVNGVYWICDAYGLYCGPEDIPYKHPVFPED